VIIVQGLAIIGLLAMEFYPSPNALTDSRWRENLAFLALGPFLTLQTIMLQNQGWVSELSGLPGDWGFVFVLVANSLAVIGVWGGYRYQHLFQPTPSLAVAFLIPALNLILIRPGMFFIPGLLASQFLFGWSWAHMANLTAYANYKGLVRTVIMTTCGLFLFMFTAFIYYASLDLTLPIYREAILPISAAVFAVIFLGICLQGPRARTRSRLIHEPVLMVGGLCLISLLHLIFNQPAQIEDTSPKEAAIIMTYNIHSAYDVQGRQNPEAIAEVIEESEADIVALQEISRGWLVNGSTDLITWLSHRLGMHVVYKGTTGPMWGNAILSKYPILRVQHAELPSLGTPLGRGYLMAKIDIGQGRPIWIYATHLHAEQEDALVRHAQISHLLSEWGNRPYSVILGDLNAEPNDAEIKLLHTAGLVDAWTETGVGNGNTFISSSPYKRIDWIWHTPDLSAQDAWVPKTTASDHLPVVVTIIP
jgi:endonuclease/exonuclease/phosphatase family metal-dependent hydrolase